MTGTAPTSEDLALYVPDGDRFVPTILTQGPWDPNAQHGGPVAALLTRGVESVPTLVPMRCVRLTVDLLRAAPLRPLRLRPRVVREGKRIQLVECVLVDDGDREVARLLALRVRIGDTGEDAVMAHPRRPPVAPPPHPTGAGRPLQGDRPVRVGFIRAIDAERVVGDVGLGSPSVMWVRLRVPLVAGTPTTPIERLAVAADFTSALASYLDGREYSFINPDVNVHVLRVPASDWIGIDGTTWVEADGIGQGRAALYDLDGLVGTGSAAQIVDRWHRPEWGR